MTTKRETKAARRAALRARLSAALADIYGNARTPWADDVPGFTPFYDWLGDYAQREHDYMTGENSGRTKHETRGIWWRPAAERLRNARRGPQRYATQARDTARNFHGFPCGPFETERAVIMADGVGECYAHGRNGKTVYPVAWARSDVGGLRVFEDRAADLNAAELTRAVQWLEQFNAHVRSVAADAPACYRADAADALADKQHDARAELRMLRGTFATLAGELRALRGINAPAACEVLRERLAKLRRAACSCARTLRETGETLRELRADGAA